METPGTEPAAYVPLQGDFGSPPDATPLEPVSASEFEVMRRFYSYDPVPLDGRAESTTDEEYWRRERVSFTAAYDGERVLANILIPKNAAPPYQAVIWFPGSYALDLRSSEGDLPFSVYFDFVARSGRALVYPVYKDTYERRRPAIQPGPGHAAVRNLVIRWSQDLGRTIDYLAARDDFDASRIAYYGYSMGAGLALPLVAVEPRLKTAVLLAGGLEGRPEPPEIDPVNFMPRATLPVLMLGGRKDFLFPIETSQVPLFNLLGAAVADKRHAIFEEAGHIPPRIALVREVLDWLDRHLGPVTR
jgi:cephalosporin-C deacetylase-like acetyl esterase